MSRIDIDTRAPGVRTLFTVLLTGALIIGLGVAFVVVSFLMKSTRVMTSQVDFSDSAQIVLRVPHGEVELVEGTGDDAIIRSEITSGLLKNGYQVGRRGDTLMISATCRLFTPVCEAKVTVRVPQGLPVEVFAESGSVTAEGLKDRLLTISTVAGDITTHDLNVDELTVDTETGSVDASFAKAPYAFKATTISGDVRALIPPTKKISYDVTLRSKGSMKSAIKDASEPQGFIRVISKTGDIRIESGK